MSRTYTTEFDNVTISAVQDIISLQSTASMVFEVDQANFGQITATSIGNLRTTLKRFSGAYTIGSGGTAPTPGKHVFGDSAATVTSRVNDTTQTTGGTSVKLPADAINVVNGWLYLPAREDRIAFTISQAFVWSLDTAPSPGEVSNGSCQFRETV